ncbi:MAG: serine/threonine protein kinase, partial [Bryobacteraceae bacterium]|nr:serine/threonine protein kinase [Bryobacteraceae bacterium]
MAETLVGELIAGRYRATKELSRGGFGALYLAQDQQVRDKVVVIKVLSPREDSPDNEPWFRKKFDTEIEALARINHPGVVAIHDAGHLDSGRPFLVMQYIEGYTLGNALTNLGLDLGRTANIVRQIGQALDAAHSKGVTHRDMKPENVMLTPLSSEIGPPKEHVTLIDFGIASVEDDQVGRKEKTRLAGSFAYMAPEQLDGRPVPASDLYSLGVIAYEMLTGQTPFSQESLFKFLASQRQGVKVKPRELRPEIPPSAEKIILDALSFKAADRPASIKEFAENLAQALESGATAPEESPAAWWGRNLIWITWAGFALLLAVAVFFGPQIGPW